MRNRTRLQRSNTNFYIHKIEKTWTFHRGLGAIKLWVESLGALQELPQLHTCQGKTWKLCRASTHDSGSGRVTSLVAVRHRDTLSWLERCCKRKQLAKRVHWTEIELRFPYTVRDMEPAPPRPSRPAIPAGKIARADEGHTGESLPEIID